ncbi:MAG: IS607 family transposase [Candidatus Dormibacteria bacterium]
MLRLGAAARRLGIHPLTLRRWADTGRIEVVWVGRERRFPIGAVDHLRSDSAESRPSGGSRVAGYARVSGTTGQEGSFEAQEAELRARFGSRLVAVYQDNGSGLRESRRGLERVLKAAEAGRLEVLAVTHADRLARFGTTWLERLLLRDGVKLEVLNERGAAGGMPELLEDFITLVATFSGRMYGILSAEAKRRLLEQAHEEVERVQAS